MEDYKVAIEKRRTKMKMMKIEESKNFN